MEIYVLNFVPKVCPACGERIGFDRQALHDYLAGAQCSCRTCNAHFRYMSGDKLEIVLRSE